MPDVFFIAILILNMKFDSIIIISGLKNGITIFTISVALLMISPFKTGKYQPVAIFNK